MYQCVQLPWMQSSSVRIVHWKQKLLHALVTKKHKYFPGICEAAGGKAATPPIPGLCFQRISMFFYSLLKSAANAVLKLMSAVIAIAHVLFVSMKSVSVSIMQFDYSFGKLK